MATVYLAQDLKHDRQVAIKVLRPELAAVLGRERFLAEIRLTAKLDHPHILTLIDSGEVLAEQDDAVEHGREAPCSFLYYVLPYVRGESLRRRLDTEKQLPIDETVRIARQVASALDYAHRQGVIHRDIKPENILLHEGEAMLADFGIALAVREAGGERLTEIGLSLGTPEYMSPEQATGERDLTGRSDLFSLAEVVYEMLTGEPPFQGRTPQAVVAKLITERPVPIRAVRDTVSPRLEATVLKALAKVPADRFPNGGDFAAALSDGMPIGSKPIAALPGRRRRWSAMLGSIAVVLVLGVIARHLLKHGTMRITTSDIRHVTSEQGVEFEPALSPDGKRWHSSRARSRTHGWSSGAPSTRQAASSVWRIRPQEASGFRAGARTASSCGSGPVLARPITRMVIPTVFGRRPEGWGAGSGRLRCRGRLPPLPGRRTAGG